MYVDLALSRTFQRFDELQLLGITALYLAMNIEEVDLKSCRKFSECTAGAFSPFQIAQKQRELVKCLNWKLYPETLCQWLDSFCEIWDSFIVHYCPNEAM